MPENSTVAIIDDEADMRTSISQWLELSGFQTRTFESAEKALAHLSADFRGVVVSDIKMPGMDGMALLRKLKMVDSTLPVILITGHGDVQMAVEAMRIGAYDFIEKPFDPERLADLVRHAGEERRLTLDNRALRRELSDGSVLLRRLMGASPAIEKLREDILDMSQADGNVLIFGETGTGKNLIARALHACGPRQGKPFISLNCSALSDEEFAARMFGPAAVGGQTPIMTIRSACTVCLDMVEAVSPAMQARLIEALEAMERQRPADDAPPIRILSISSVSPEETRAALRPDLYFRLSAMELTAPNLRDRGEDILLLFNRFAQLFAEDYGCEVPDVTAQDAANLLNANWPGNIRQLQNLAERSVLRARRGEGSISDLLVEEGMQGTVTGTTEKPLKEHLESFERMLIENSLRRNKGSVSAAMDELALPRRTLNEKMAKYGLSRADYL